MQEIGKKISFEIRGDKAIVVLGIILMAISFLMAYSTSSNMVNLYAKHTNWFYLFKHFFIYTVSLLLFLLAINIPVEKYKKWALPMLWVSIFLLVWTFLFGVAPNGSHARRWIKLPFATIQPSLIAIPVLLLYTSVYLDKIKHLKTSFKEDVKKYWIYFFIVIGLIIPFNNSTGAIGIVLVFTVLSIGGYSFRKLLIIIAIMFGLLAVYVGAAKAFPKYVPNRFDTLEGRISDFLNGKERTQTLYAKIAIARGGLFRFAPGKSVVKNLMSQSSSDFVYSIIIEEYGLVGGILVLLLYVILFVYIVNIARLQQDYFRKITAIALGLPVITQALLNMIVGTGIIPVTGQPLPLISTGGTTIMMTVWSLGVIEKISETVQKP